MVPGRLAAGGLGAVGGAYAVTKAPDAVQGFLNEAFPAWVNAARAALQATPQLAPAAKDSAQVELLSASVKSLSTAVDGALRSQRAIVGGGAAGTLVLVGTPLAVLAYYLRNHGWWVTAQELQEAQRVCDAAVHPVLKEPIPSAFRVCSFLPVTYGLSLAMISTWQGQAL